MKWYKREKSPMGMAWLKGIDIPPPKLKFEEPDFSQISSGFEVEFGFKYLLLQMDIKIPILPDGWKRDSDFSMHVMGYHPHARWGMRRPAKSGSGAQAMYDHDGKLITGG
jgi:hypothetical protein